MHRLRSALTGLLLLAAFALAGVMLIPAALGYDRYVVLTGSMTGTYDPGSMIFNKDVPRGELRVGDVVTYVPPASSGYGHRPITHRVAEIGRDAAGRVAVRTKGDANNVADSWRFIPKARVSTVRGSVPHVGRVYAELSTRRGRLLAFVVPGILIAAWVLVGVWRDAGEQLRRREAEAAAAAAKAAPGVAG